MGKAIFDNNNQIITLFKLSFPLNETSFNQRDLLKLPTLIKLSQNGIALGKDVFDNNDQNILLFKLPFPLNEASFMKRDFSKLPKPI